VTYKKTAEQLQQDAFLRVLSLLSPQRVKGQRKTRVGADFDGGYVVLNNLSKTKICYSLGIGTNINFDIFMAKLGATVYMYDHTIDGLPSQHKNFRFFKTGIAPRDDWGPSFKRLDTIVSMNGHFLERNMFLKMDIEGNEWNCFDSIPSRTVGQFDQIVCEFHNFEKFTTPEFSEQATRVFEKLHQTHRVIHVHGNNNLPFAELWGVPVPRVFELTFANVQNYQFEPSSEIFPTALDQPCHPLLPDLFLGPFQFGRRDVAPS
jgi:hypothetical protein